MSLIATLNQVAQEVAALVDDDHPDDEDFEVSSSAPALANFALLVADGDANKYVEVLSELYHDNGLMVPDFGRYLEDSEIPSAYRPFEEDVSFMNELISFQINCP